MLGNVEVEEVEECGNKYLEAVARYDILMDQIERKLRSFKEMEKQNATEQEERRMEQMMMEMQLHIQKEEEHKAIKSYCNVLKIKFPKLQITRFSTFTKICLDFGTNSIMKTIDLSCLLSQNYLKKLVSPKFRVIIDGLSLTSEGYTRPKFILVSKYRKFSKVANAHIQNLMSLPHINSANLYKKDEFTEKLLGIVKALTIIDKLWLLG